jgi:hypothetical protein
MKTLMWVPLLLMISGIPELPALQAVLQSDEDFCVECCSLYCAASPTPRVSSHLEPHHRDSYGPEALADGKGQTAWVVARGPGEWFELVFEPAGFHPDVPENNTRTGVDRLYLWNGYNKSPERWREHARVHHLRLDVDDRPVAVLTLLDEQRPQRVDLPRTLLRRGMHFRFTVLDVFPGNRFDELAVSEVRLDGFGHH